MRPAATVAFTRRIGGWSPAQARLRQLIIGRRREDGRQSAKMSASNTTTAGESHQMRERKRGTFPRRRLAQRRGGRQDQYAECGAGRVACETQRPNQTTMSGALAGNGLAPCGSSGMALMPPCRDVLPARPSCCSAPWLKRRRSRTLSTVPGAAKVVVLII